MGLRPSSRTYGCGIHRKTGSNSGELVQGGGFCPNIIARTIGRALVGVCLGYMAVQGDLAGGQSDGFHAGGLPLNKPWPHMHRETALQVREREGRLAIASVRGANQIEERVILIYGDDCAITKGPPHWRKVSGEHPDLAYKRA